MKRTLLGSGYGDLQLETFLELVTHESQPFEGAGIDQLTVCCDHASTFRELVVASTELGATWIVEGNRTSQRPARGQSPTS